MNTGKIALGILAAAATGVVMGMLFAPAKGAALRRKIRRESVKRMDEVKEKLGGVVDDLSQKFEKVKDNVTDFASRKATEPEGVKTADAN